LFSVNSQKANQLETGPEKGLKQSQVSENWPKGQPDNPDKTWLGLKIDESDRSAAHNNGIS